jgi:hypothetical protein
VLLSSALVTAKRVRKSAHRHRLIGAVVLELLDALRGEAERRREYWTGAPPLEREASPSWPHSASTVALPRSPPSPLRPVLAHKRVAR